MKNKTSNIIIRAINTFFLLFCALILIFPVLTLLVNSFETPGEIITYYYSENKKTFFRFIPEVLDIKQYYEALLGSSTYTNAMMNSILYALPTTVLQLFLAVPAGGGLVVYCKRGKGIIIAILMLLMLLPYQAIEIPNYMFMRTVSLVGNPLSVILSNLFQPFSICVIIFLTMSIEREQIEAAELDGASILTVIIRIIFPQIISGIVIVFLLQFIDMWNMTEQPLIFLDKTDDMPLSILLPNLTSENPGYAFGFSIFFIIPVVLLYYSFNSEISGELTGDSVFIKR